VTSEAGSASSRTLTVLRGVLLGILLFALVGTGIELLLLEHTEDAWQLSPLVLIGLCLAVLAWHAFRPGPVSLRVFQLTMLLFLGSGVAGTWLHYRGNAEFEREMTPALTGSELFKRAMMGATPALAPGTMIWLGLLGLAYAFRHPALTARPKQSTTNDQRP
jgi:hypothetical protein